MTNLYSYYIQVLFLSFIVINHLVEIYLSRRQLSTLHQNRDQVPLPFASFLNLEDHQRAINYATAKLNFGQAHLLWHAVLLFYWFPFRGAEKLFLAMPEWGMHREVLFLVSFGIIQMLLNLPWSIFSTFVLEQRHGFNRTTPQVFLLDRLKGLFISGILIIPLLYAVFFLFQKLGTWWWAASFLLVTFFQLALVWLYPTFIAPLFNKFSPLEGEDLKRGIDDLVTRAGFKSKGVFVMDASPPFRQFPTPALKRVSPEKRAPG
jgi:STE24 endopeptidase